MAINIHNLVAAVSPDTFCDPSLVRKVKQSAKAQGYLEAAKIAKIVSAEAMDYDMAHEVDPFAKVGISNPIENHSLIYDSGAEGLEPVYFWILDFMNDMFSGKVDILIDNFISSPGSGHFSEMGQKLTKMQEEAGRWLGATNQLVKSILNLIYDLKEFKLRLEPYNKLKSPKPEERYAAELTLKQIWLDTVDIKRGGSAIKQLAATGANQPNFVTLIDAFMASKNEKLQDAEGKPLDLNDRVKRILKQRIQEYNLWKTQSEKELSKRFDIEKSYLKSQVNTVKLYARWIKPYLKAAQQLEQSTEPSAAVVTAFNTMVLELSIMGQGKYNPEGDIQAGELPESFKRIKARSFSPVVIVEFKFRSIPQKIGQHYAFGGRVEVNFTSYALNDEELKAYKQALEEDNFGDVMKLIAGATDESLATMQEDIDEFLEEKPQKEEKTDENPFMSLFSFLKTEKKSKKEEAKPGMIKKDSETEKILRSLAIIQARESCYSIFDIYKKAHGMPSHVSPYDRV